MPSPDAPPNPASGDSDSKDSVSLHHVLQHVRIAKEGSHEEPAMATRLLPERVRCRRLYGIAEEARSENTTIEDAEIFAADADSR